MYYNRKKISRRSQRQHRAQFMEEKVINIPERKFYQNP